MDLPSLTTVLVFFEDRLTVGRGALFSDVQNITTILVTFEVVFAGLYLSLGQSSDIKAIARKILTIGFFYYVIKYYGDVLRYTVDGFLYAGEKAGSGVAVNFATLRDPGEVFVRGMQIARPVSDKLFANYDASYFGIPSLDSLLLLFCMILTVFSFAVMSIQVFITYLEYLLIATAGFIIIPFGIFKPTAFLAERVFGSIISYGIKLMILALIIGVSDSFMQTVAMPVEVSWQQAIELSVIALALAFLSLRAPSVAQALLTGSPQLSAGTIVATAAGAGQIGSRAASAIGSPAASLTLAAAGAMHGGGAAATGKLGSVSEEKGIGAKSARMASKATAYGLGSIGGLISGTSSETFGKMAYGSSGSPNGSRSYRQKIGDPSLGSHGSSRQSSGGIVGRFNAGKYSVSQYRNYDQKNREEKSQKEDQKITGEARSEIPKPDTQETKSDSTEANSSKEKA